MSRPPLLFDRALLRLRRARAAAYGGAGGFLLDEVAASIAERLAFIQRRFDVALDLGSGGAALAQALAGSGKVGTVIRAERSAGLLQGWPGLALLCDEEALPFAAGSLDLVVSGLALQWVNDLPGTLAQIAWALRPDGLLIAALAGAGTLQELREALTEAELELTGGAAARVAPFADVRAMGGLLQRAGLALPVCDMDTVSVGYADMGALIGELRAMGATNMLTGARKPLTRQAVRRAAEIYAERFGDPRGRVRATFNIVYVTAWAPHHSQQKPLRPGSARMRLADALKARGEPPAGEGGGEAGGAGSGA